MKFLKNNFVVKFTISLFLVSITVGILAFFAFKPELTNQIENFKNLILTTNQNVFLIDIGIITMIFIASISIIGLPLIIFYIFYEGMSIGFTAGAFIYTFKIKGFGFYLLFLMATKLIFLLLIFYFIIVSIRFTYKIIGALIYKNKENLYDTVINQFARFVIILILIILNSSMIYFLTNKFLTIFIDLI